MTNIKPVHKNGVSLGSSTTFSSTTNFLTGSSRAFRAGQALGSSTTFSSVAKSGFQYITASGGGTSTITKIFDEYSGAAVEDMSRIVTRIYDEYSGAVEEGSSGVLIEEDFSLRVEIMSLRGYDNSLVVSIGSIQERAEALRIDIIPYDPAPVTDTNNPSNPYNPTIYIAGVPVLNNPATAYTTPPDSDYYGAVFVESPLAGVDICANLKSHSMTLDYLGGTFQVASKEPVTGSYTYSGNLGVTLPMYGFTGTITRWGKSASAGDGPWFNTSGIFGNPNMNKQISLVMQTDPRTFALLTNQNLAIAQVDAWQSYSGAAFAIANAANVSVSWNVRDFPLLDFSASEGSTTLSALGGLAAQVGATLRWNGGNRYSVVYPNYFSGLWTVPHDRYISAWRYDYIKDLETGVSGTGVLGMPVLTTQDTGKTQIPVGIPVEKLPEVYYTTRDPLDPKVPDVLIDLPNDTESLKIQIRVKDSTLAGQWITANESIWYDLGTPSLTNPYCKIVNKNGTWIPQLRVSHLLFPNLDAIANGEFIMSIGIIRYDQQAIFNNAKAERDAIAKQIIARTIGQFQYIKTYEGTITAQWFGSVPTPGMWGSATTACGDVVEGIIENVQINNKQITVQVAQYVLVNFLQNTIDITPNP